MTTNPRTATERRLAGPNQCNRVPVRLILAAGALFLFCNTGNMALLLTQFNPDAVENVKTAPVYLTNDAEGVTFDSLKFDSQLADLLWQAYGVSGSYGNDFTAFINSGAFGYEIFPGSNVVSDGWNSSVNPDGTISIERGFFGAEPFSTGETMTGNYFFSKSLLDTDGDGYANYTFHLLSDAQGMDNFTSPLTKTGIVGSSLGGNFAEAYGQGATDFPASGQAYALVPTDYHPQIPEPAAYASVLGALALAGGMYRRRRASGGKIVRSA